MSEMLDALTAQKIKAFWIQHNPLRLDEYKSELFQRDVTIADLEKKLSAARDTLKRIANHECPGEICYDEFAYNRMEKMFKKTAKEALKLLGEGTKE